MPQDITQSVSDLLEEGYFPEGSIKGYTIYEKDGHEFYVLPRAVGNPLITDQRPINNSDEPFELDSRD